jgi:hypothetical protein
MFDGRVHWLRLARPLCVSLPSTRKKSILREPRQEFVYPLITLYPRNSSPIGAAGT